MHREKLIEPRPEVVFGDTDVHVSPAGIPADDRRRRGAPNQFLLDADGTLTQSVLPPTPNIPRAFVPINLGKPGPEIGVDCREEKFLGSISGPFTGAFPALARGARKVRRKIPHVSCNLFGEANLPVDLSGQILTFNSHDSNRHSQLIRLDVLER